MTQGDTFDSFALSTDARWLLQVEGFDPKLEPTIEAVLAMVNGYLGVRAALEEGSAVSRPSTLISGVFNTPAKAQPELDEPVPELVVAPDWSHLRIRVEGQDLRLDQVELLGQRRVLDLRQGILLREWRVRDGGGRITHLRSIRFASLDDRHTLVHLLVLTPENYSGQIQLEALVDGAVQNEFESISLESLEAREIPQGELLRVRTRQSGYELAFAAHADLRDAQGTAIVGTSICTPQAIGQRWEWQATQGTGYEMRKIVAVYTSRDTDAPGAAATDALARTVPTGVSALLSAQRAAWGARWHTSDAEIARLDDTQIQVRFALYHLIGAANPHDERSSVGARALTGERYRGHVFWDNEIFVWPFYLYTHPKTARALLMYRYHTLNGARNKARAMDYQGALYPWEATDTGEETTPAFMWSGGERIPVLTGIEEHHISADIAYAVWQYRSVTGDEAFFLDYGAEMLLEIARFWASRVVAGDDGAYHILKVIGPDEYHESVDDNAYTNMMAQWTLRRGLETAAELEASHPARWHALTRQLNLSRDELDHWQRVADSLVTGFDPQTGLFEQFRGYHRLEEIDLTDHDTNVATVDAKLGWYAMQKTKVLKQADVVMLQFLLWDDLPPEIHETNFRYYEPYTSHDSSLSPSFHALVAARLNDMPLAERYLHHAARIDLDFTRKGWAGATGGVHIAALGGIWQALAFGFLGMRPQREGLRFVPHIPPHWGSLRLPVQWRGAQLLVTVTSETQHIEISVLSGGPVTLAIGTGDWQIISNGETVTREA